MPFCTNCGANVAGAFCNQCGTPARADQPVPAPPPGIPAKRKTHPIVWVLVAVLGLFVLGFVAVIGTGFFVYNKAKQAGVDPELFRTNPGLAIGRMAAAANPDVEVLRTDDAAGTITLRDRKNGKEFTLTFDEAKSGKIRFSAEEDGKTATVEIGGGDLKLPSWVPSYPDVSIKATFRAHGESNDGVRQGGSFSFTTHDSASKVLSFYEEKVKERGFKVNLNATGGEGGTFMATDEDQRSITVIAGESRGETTVNVTYGSK